MTRWRICLFTAALILSAGTHIAVASFWQEIPKAGAVDNGSGGLVVSLGPAGRAPGVASASQAKTRAQDDAPMSDNAAPPQSSEVADPVADENNEVSEVHDPNAMERDDPVNAPPLSSVVAETPKAKAVSENIEDMNWDVVTAAEPAQIPDVTPAVKSREKEKPAAKTLSPRPPAKKPTPLMKPKKVAALVRKVSPKPRILNDRETIQEQKNADAHLPLEEDQSSQMANLVSGQGGNTGIGGESDAGEGDNMPGGGTPGAQADYFAEVQDWLERHKRYPRRAKLRQLQGVAVLRFIVMRDGSISRYSVEESSGHSLLDAEVLKLVVRAQPLPSIPKNMPSPEIELFVPIEFSLN